MGNKILSNCFENKRNSGYKPIRIASCFQEEEKLTLNEKFYGTKTAPAIIHIIYKDGTERYYKARGKHVL